MVNLNPRFEQSSGRAHIRWNPRGWETSPSHFADSTATRFYQKYRLTDRSRGWRLW
jgi:hypothetical protein